ncbi:bifunctional DNA primase/polymerase [Myceligenerans crystallogenes]
MDTHLPAEFAPRARALVAAFRAPSTAATATLLARAGVPAFPCVPGGKPPFTKRGFHDATTDLGKLERFWRRWPDANLAIPTGRVSGFDVVDVDMHDGTSGRSAFDASLKVGLTSGWAFTVRTPSGGLHAYFPNVAEQASWACAPAHVDFRADGGYIVVPPSRVVYDDGQSGIYRLAAVADHPAAPVDGAALREFLAPPRPKPRRDFVPAPGASRSDPERLAAWIAAHPEDGRKQRLFWAACRAVEAGHDLETTLVALGNAALSVGVPARIAESAIRSAFRHTSPRAEPPAAGRSSHPTSPGGGRRPEPPRAVIS